MSRSLSRRTIDEKALKDYAIHTNRQINTAGAGLSKLYQELGLALLRLRMIPAYGAHGRWGDFPQSLGHPEGTATKAMAIAATYKKSEQLEQMTVEKAYKGTAKKRRTEGNHHKHIQGTLPPTGQVSSSLPPTSRW